MQTCRRFDLLSKKGPRPLPVEPKPDDSSTPRRRKSDFNSSRKARCPKPNCEKRCSREGHRGHKRNSDKLCSFVDTAGVWCINLASRLSLDGRRSCAVHAEMWVCTECHHQNDGDNSDDGSDSEGKGGAHDTSSRRCSECGHKVDSENRAKLEEVRSVLLKLSFQACISMCAQDFVCVSCPPSPTAIRVRSLTQRSSRSPMCPAWTTMLWPRQVWGPWPLSQTAVVKRTRGISISLKLT
jgi:hypothetical protein